MSQTRSNILRVADLSQNKSTRFTLTLDTAQMSAIATGLGLDALRKLRFEGTLVSEGKHDWRLEAKLGATVVQPCVVTLAPVTTRIDGTVTRRFLAQMPDDVPEDEEIEMPEDETIDQLGSQIDLDAVMSEALALALPLYPRAADATLTQAQFTEPGKAPMRDEDARPFAGLKSLRDSLDGNS